MSVNLAALTQTPHLTQEYFPGLQLLSTIVLLPSGLHSDWDKPGSSALQSTMPYPCAKSHVLVAVSIPLLLSEKVKDCVFLLKHLQSKS